MMLRSLACAVALSMLLPAFAHGQSSHSVLRDRGDAGARAAFEQAYLAWDGGDYMDALERLQRILAGPDGETLLEPIALLTGELYATVELTADGRAPRWSPDGRFASYETGTGAGVSTHIVAVGAAAVRPVASVGGSGLAFAPGGGSVAYLSATDSLADARIMVRELATGRERELRAPGVTRASLVYTANGDLYLVGGTPGQAAPDRVVRVTGADAPAMVLAGGRGAITGARALGGANVLLSHGRGGSALLNVTTAQVRALPAPTASSSADGRYLVFAVRDSTESRIELLDLAAPGEARTVFRTSAAVASPAISPDGRRIAFQMMPREDWELYVVGADGGEPLRITREIQHDLLPQFLSEDRLLAAMGEARHRRSHLYELPAAATELPVRVRLFHNNTVRTVAPEYEWVPSPDGTRLLIVAERDGDTVSPERGVYLMDLSSKVGRDAVEARIANSLAHERALREKGTRTFARIAPAVRDAVADVSTARISGYAHDLYQFDSKFITQPGNQKAIEYLAAQLRSWGYEPELQWFDARGVRTANVIAKLPGTTNPELIYTVSSHFDSVQRGPGADDDSSGTSALLEAARALKDRPQPATIHFAFFTGEEAGLLGSREYVRRAVAAGDQIVGALNNDMVGFANDHRLDNTIRYSNDGIRDIQHAAAFLFTNLITYDAKYYKSTDAAAYYEAYGDIVGGIGSYPILGNPHYHQPHDVLETINQQLVAEVSRTTVATLMLLASSPSRVKDVVVAARRGGEVEVRWTASPESDVREYVVAYGPAAEPMRRTVKVTEPRATLSGVSAGDVIGVRAVNAVGLEGWDWARATVR